MKTRDEVFYNDLTQCSDVIARYNIFIMAKNNNIFFTAEDITYEDLQLFEEIRGVLDGK